MNEEQHTQPTQRAAPSLMPDVLAVLGLFVLSAGCALAWVPGGLIVLGLGMIVCGVLAARFERIGR